MIDFFPQTTHAELSPSSASRWINCTASILLKREYGLEDKPAGDAANIGTIAHKLAEIVLNGKELHQIIEENQKQIDELIKHFDFDLELMMRNVEYFCRYVSEQSQNVSHIYSEEWLQIIDQYTHGTADIIGYNSTTKHCHIIDFKYGKVSVTPRHNPQMMLYAIGVLRTLHTDIEAFTLHIYQPNSFSKSIINTWNVTKNELIVFEKIAKKAVEAISNNESYYTTNIDICKYCICKGICPQYEKLSA